MIVTPLRPVGAEIAGAPVDRLDDADVERLRGRLAEHGVLVWREQHIDDDAFLAFLLRFGRPVFTVGETPLPGYPDLNVVSNVGRSTPPRSAFHVDTSYVSRPPAYTALRAVSVPAEGGATLFSNQYRACEQLSAEARRGLEGRTVTHVVTGVDPGDAQEQSAVHPLLRPHPVSGRVALYLTTPQRCAAVSGLGETEAAATVARLYEHSTAADNLYRHQWRPGDVVMWDNGAVMHKADHTQVVGDRVLHRGMVDGYAGARP